MKTYTIEITDAQDKALRHVALDPQQWIQNVVNVRCDVAIDDIVKLEIERRLAAGDTISGSKADIVLSAPIESAVEQQARFDAMAQQG
jgi:hypothetical protein